MNFLKRKSHTLWRRLSNQLKMMLLHQLQLKYGLEIHT